MTDWCGWYLFEPIFGSFGTYDETFFDIFYPDTLFLFLQLLSFAINSSFNPYSHLLLISTLCFLMYRCKLRDVRTASRISSSPLKISDSILNLMYLFSFYRFFSALLKEGVLIPDEFSSLSGVDMVSMLVLWALGPGLKKSRGNLAFLMGSLARRLCIEMLLLSERIPKRSVWDMRASWWINKIKFKGRKD